MLSSKHAKKYAKKQAALSREQADKLRAHAAEEKLASQSEIDSLRTLRSLDLPAFRQASEQAVIQAQKGAERMQRQRMMGRLAPDVRQAIFGGQFQQYVGRESQRLSQYAGLTERILRATEVQQQRALGVEQQAIGIDMGGQMQALQAEAQAGDPLAGILGAVGQAASAFAASKSAAASKAEARDADFAEALALSDVPTGELRTRAAEISGMTDADAVIAEYGSMSDMPVGQIARWKRPRPQESGGFWSWLNPFN